MPLLLLVVGVVMLLVQKLPPLLLLVGDEAGDETKNIVSLSLSLSLFRSLSKDQRRMRQSIIARCDLVLPSNDSVKGCFLLLRCKKQNSFKDVLYLGCCLYRGHYRTVDFELTLQMLVVG